MAINLKTIKQLDSATEAPRNADMIINDSNGVSKKVSVANLQKNTEKLIAPVEASSTATVKHDTDSLFVYNGTLYKATADIAVGGTITPNTNCTATDVETELSMTTGATFIGETMSDWNALSAAEKEKYTFVELTGDAGYGNSYDIPYNSTNVGDKLDAISTDLGAKSSASTVTGDDAFSKIATLKQTLSQISSGDLMPYFNIVDANYDVYFTSDVVPTSFSNLTRQEKTDFAQSLYDLFNELGGTSGKVYIGRISKNYKKKSDHSQLSSAQGFFILYSNASYSNMISNNATARLSFMSISHGQAYIEQFGIWGTELRASRRGVLGQEDISVIAQQSKGIYDTISS